MSHRLRLTAEKVAQRLRLMAVRWPARARRSNASGWKCCPTPRSRPDATVFACDSPGPELDWDSYWGEQNLHFVLRSRFTVPRGWRNPALHLPLGVAGDIFTHPEALLYIDGKPWPLPTGITTRWTSTRRWPTASPMT
jgi:alpha-mannosidase